MLGKLFLKTAFISSVFIASIEYSLADGHGHNKSDSSYTVSEVASGLEHPWSIAFLPSGEALITERPGSLRLLRKDASLSEAITGLPKIEAKGQGGLMGVAVHPQFSENRLIYLCANVRGDGGAGSEVHVGKLVSNELVNTKEIFVAKPKSQSGYHFGCRITFDQNNDVFISLGDRGKQDLAQDLDSHNGKVIKISDDGKIPKDNPFVGKISKTDIFSYGHRNVQGMTMHPDTGEIWTHEHGPKGGDEINILSAGDNYGWPVITYGVNYNGSSITDKTEMQGMRQPLKYWDPSIAPSGMTFYAGDMFPLWKNHLFVGSLKFRYLLSLGFNDKGEVIAEQKLLEDMDLRIRDVAVAPDGSIYVLSDSTDGKVLRIHK